MFNVQPQHPHSALDSVIHRGGQAHARAPWLASVFVMFVAAVFASIIGATSVGAAVPPAGTLLSNTATSNHQVGGVPQTTNSNTVTATVGAVGGVPTLVKRFADQSISSGNSVALYFDIINSSGSPGQVGLGFTDTLPAGLRLSPMPVATLSPGCGGTITFPSASTIAVSGLSIVVGTPVCRITVNGVTNAPNAQNADCSVNPVNFTNGASSISGIVSLANAVTNQCLVIVPLITQQPNNDLFFAKSISANSGNSPSTGYRITLRFGNSNLPQAVKTNVVIADVLPAGMTFVPGTLVLSNAPPATRVETGLPAASGTFTFNGAAGTYETQAGQVSLTFNTMAPGDAGFISFDVNIAPGLAVPSTVDKHRNQYLHRD
jgi:uncharacterized repeat protein (TIGR01451 family)